MAQLRISLFGYPTLALDDAPVGIDERKALAILAYLAMSRAPQGREALCALLWPDYDRGRAYANLRHALWALKHAGLSEWLEQNRDAIALIPGYWLDSDAFQEAIQVSQLDAAVALYQGDFLAGFTLRDAPDFDAWQRLHAQQLRARLADVLQRLADTHSGRGAYDLALAAARRWLALDRLHEAAHRHLMQLYALAGQPAAALRQYQECAQLLEDELGVSPHDATVALYRTIRAGQVRPLSTAEDQGNTIGRATVNAPSSYPTADRVTTTPPVAVAQLPIPAAPLIGREREVAELGTLIADSGVRLVTIVGAGGIGKTRLALEVAARSQHAFVDGIVCAALQSIGSTDELIAAIATAADVPLTGRDEPREQLLAALKGKQKLLLLDNFEHLLGEVHLLNALLAAAPSIRLLVTSREVLNLQEEWIFALSGLAVPPEAEHHALERFSAVQLFVDRARQVRREFALTAEQEAVARICRLVEGLPLAIELAASWARTLPCAAIATEIERNLLFLATSLRDVPARHRSMRAVFDHSWNLLSQPERDVFMRLSIFRGGFSREAAAQVAGAILPILVTLVDKSMVQHEGEGRYHIHELLRQYASEHLEHSPQAVQQAHDAHSGYYTHYLDGRPLEAAAEIEADLDNIRGAWQWAVAHAKIEEIYRSSHVLLMYYQVCSRYREGVNTFAAAVDRLRSMPASKQRDKTLALLLLDQGWLCIRLGWLDEAQAVLEESRGLYAHHLLPLPPGHSTDPTCALGILALVLGRYQEAAHFGEEALREGEAQNHQENVAAALYLLARAAMAQGHYEPARRFAMRACAISETTGNQWYLAYCRNELGNIAYALGEYGEARRQYQASYNIRERYPDPEGMAVTLNHLGRLAMHQDQYTDAQHLFERSFAIYNDIGDRGGLATSLDGLGTIALAQGEYDSARQRFRQALEGAAAIQFVPCIFSLMIGIGELLIQTGHMERAREILELALYHPASERETRDRAQRLIRCYLASPVPGTPAMQRSQPGDLEPAVARLLIDLPGLAPRAESAAFEMAGRTQAPAQPDGVHLDVEARELVVDDQRIRLSHLEFGVMRYLVEREGKTVSRGDLLEHVWDYSYDGGSNVVAVVVRSLRKKLGRHAAMIETVTKVGYRFRQR